MEAADELDLAALQRRYRSALERYRKLQPDRPLRSFFDTPEAKSLWEQYRNALSAAYRNAGADPGFFVLDAADKQFRVK
ncbi:MAG TPA: hypothetical protein DEH78_06500 [Solibacterales bacterium]|nr:hypothetical protein [Bryobacterales bacterium]